jgi:hypothetical protein
MVDPSDMNLDPNWEFVPDAVMGGISEGGMTRETYQGREATVLRGDVSLDNNGGFIQIAFNLRSDGAGVDASAWDGIELDLCGNGETYDIRLRTDQLARPWQSFRTEVQATRQWQPVRIPFRTLVARKTEATFDPQSLRRIGILAIGREFQAEIAVAGARLYRVQ